MIFQFFSFLPALQVNAEDNITQFPFITGVTITDGNGEPISGPINTNAEVRLNYNFELPNQGDIKKGQSYIMHIPKELEIIAQLNFEIDDKNSGEKIADVTIDTDGKVTIVFTEFVEKHSNVSGYFYIQTNFDETEIGGENKVPIEFVLGGSGNSITIDVEFEQPEKPDASVHKKGSYDASKNEITWEVLVNPEKTKVENAQIVDFISENHNSSVALAIPEGALPDSPIIIDYFLDKDNSLLNDYIYIKAEKDSEATVIIKYGGDDCEEVFHCGLKQNWQVWD